MEPISAVNNETIPGTLHN